MNHSNTCFYPAENWYDSNLPKCISYDSCFYSTENYRKENYRKEKKIDSNRPVSDSASDSSPMNHSDSFNQNDSEFKCFYPVENWYDSNLPVSYVVYIIQKIDPVSDTASDSSHINSYQFSAG